MSIDFDAVNNTVSVGNAVLSFTQPAAPQTVTIPDPGAAGSLIATPDTAAQGAILYHNGTTWKALAASTSGWVLKTQGPGADPAWASGGGGSGTVNSGTAGRLSLYATSTTAVSDTYVQNSNNINVAIATHATLAATRTYTIPDTSADASFLMTAGAQTITGAKSFSAATVGMQKTVVGAALESWAARTNFTSSVGAFNVDVYGTYLYTAGGYRSGGTGFLNEVHSSLIAGDDSLGAWSNLNTLPVAIAWPGIICKNGYIHVVGGEHSGGYLTTAYKASITGDGTVGAWSTTSSLGFTGRTNIGWTNGPVCSYMVGGSNPSPTTTVDLFTVAVDGTLSRTAGAYSLPAARNCPAVCVCNGYLVVVGGSADGANGTNTIYTAPVNASTGQLTANFTSQTVYPASIAYTRAVAIDNTVYVFGGQTNGSTVITTVTSFRVASDGTVNTFATRVALGTAKAFIAAVKYGSNIYVLGGGTASAGTTYNTNFEYMLGSATYYNYMYVDDDGALVIAKTEAATTPAIKFTQAGNVDFPTAVTITATSNHLTLSTVGATKAIITAASHATSNRTYTIPDCGADASFVMTALAQTIGGAKTFSSGLLLTATANHLTLSTVGATKAVITAASHATADRTYTIPDCGANASFVMTALAQTVAGVKTFSSALTCSLTSNQLVIGTTRTVTITAPTPATSSRVHTIPDILAAGTFALSAATIDLTAQTALINTTTMYTTPAAAGMYIVSYCAKVTTAATTSSTLGALTIGYTDANDSVAQTVVSVTNTGNSTTSLIQGTVAVYAKASTAISYAMAYASTGATPMAYNLHIKVTAV